MEIKSDGTGTHYDYDLGTGKLSNPRAVKWKVDPTTRDPVVFALEDARLDAKGCRMHLNPNGNLSIRGNTEGALWVLVPESK
jgi:hypothetical protein